MRVRDLIEAKPQSDGSGASSIQLKYPVCFDCFDLIIGGLNTKIGKQEKLRDTYMSELLKIEKKIDRLGKEDQGALEAELRILEAEEAELDRQIELLDQESTQNENEFERLQATKASLQSEEQKFWRDVNNYEKNLVGFQESLAQANTLITSLDSQYKRLRSTNMLNEVFTISTNEELGTISGFRFGRLPTIDVKWEEINAAVG